MPEIGEGIRRFAESPPSRYKGYEPYVNLANLPLLRGEQYLMQLMYGTAVHLVVRLSAREMSRNGG